MKISIPVKPLSVNKAWRGRRFKSKFYEQYERDVSILLPFHDGAISSEELMVTYIFYLKNYELSDNDNPVKPIQDILVKRGYIKDDRYIKATLSVKIPVKKEEEERIEVDIEPYSLSTILSPEMRARVLP